MYYDVWGNAGCGTRSGRISYAVLKTLDLMLWGNNSTFTSCIPPHPANRGTDHFCSALPSKHVGRERVATRETGAQKRRSNQRGLKYRRYGRKEKNKEIYKYNPLNYK